ncbi:unnamed protein product, partial [Rhizoctonia solani]
DKYVHTHGVKWEDGEGKRCNHRCRKFWPKILGYIQFSSLPFDRICSRPVHIHVPASLQKSREHFNESHNCACLVHTLVSAIEWGVEFLQTCLPALPPLLAQRPQACFNGFHPLLQVPTNDLSVAYFQQLVEKARYKSRTSPPRPCQSQTDPSYLRPSTGNPYWLISVGDLDLGLIPDDIAESGGPTRQVMRSPAKVDSSIPRLLHTDADGWRANAQ